MSSDEQEHGDTAEAMTRRVGLSEALFRQVNEEIRDLDRGFDDDAASIGVLCECGDAGCAERIDVPTAEYERIRGDSHLYVIAPGHDFPEVERVVEQHAGYEVVRKVAGSATRIAEETDPRA